MKFGPVAVRRALGTVLAHSARLETGTLRKGTVLGREDVDRLEGAGFESVTVARLDEGDVIEDEAATRIAASLTASGIRAAPAATGRVNLFAERAGLFVPDRGAVDALNAVDPGITIATLEAWTRVAAGRMVATVKIIPLAVSGGSVDAACRIAGATTTFDLAAFRPQRINLVQTRLPGTPEKMLDKTRRVTESRLERSGSTLALETRCEHEAAALAAALADQRPADLTLVFGASAVVDIDDVIPDAIRRAGGVVRHLGMPVDPGNLLLLGERAGAPVIGAPGCARSPKDNGFDWVLDRFLAGLDVSPEAIGAMGVGGLLEEIVSRPEPRSSDPVPGDGSTVDIVVLAAGRSSRMGRANKLLSTFDGEPLVRRSVRTALAAGRARSVRLVIGHQGEAVAAAVADLDLSVVDNPAYRDGLSRSLQAGFAAALGQRADGVLVMLADQPNLTPADLDALIAEFAPRGPGSIVAAFDGERRRNPVILSALYRDEIMRLDGDVGARDILAAHPDAILEVDIGAAASFDVDTPEALAQAGGEPAD